VRLSPAPSPLLILPRSIATVADPETLVRWQAAFDAFVANIEATDDSPEPSEPIFLGC
jgi:hypothetical protein